MIEWGLKRVDEMGVETFVESTQDGIGFYKVHGFEHVMDLVLDRWSRMARVWSWWH
jgi:hypothetical protein